MTSTRLDGHRLYRLATNISIPKSTTAAATAATSGQGMSADSGPDSASTAGGMGEASQGAGVTSTELGPRTATTRTGVPVGSSAAAVNASSSTVRFCKLSVTLPGPALWPGTRR